MVPQILLDPKKGLATRHYVFLSWSHFSENYWHMEPGHWWTFIISLETGHPSKISSIRLRRWVLGLSEFALGLASQLRCSVKWCDWWLVGCKVTFSSTATPLRLLSAAVVWLPNPRSKINRFVFLPMEPPKQLPPSLRPEPPSPPILHPTGCLAEAGGRMHSVINSIHCWAEG